MNKQLGLICFVFIVGFFSCAQTNQESNLLTVTNSTSVLLKDKPVIVKRSELTGVPAGNVYPLLLSELDTIPAQLDDLDGDNQWDELFFVADLPASGTKSFSLQWVKEQPTFTPRTTIRFGKRSSATDPLKPATSESLLANELPRSLGFQRYQTDGPSWENDKVGFRHYLDGRNAKDVFGKLLPAMSPDSVGINTKGEVEDNYHVMEPWGRDILAVGNSIRIGGVALIKGDSMLRLGVTVEDKINNVQKTDFKIVTKGPGRSIMQFDYQNWQPDNKSYNVHETTSIWPGMYAYHNAVQFSSLEGSEHLGIGLVSINAEQPPLVIKVNDQWVAIVSHEKHSYNKEWWLGLALIVPSKGFVSVVEAPKQGQLSNSFMAKMNVKNNELIQYYAIAGWELSDPGFKDPAYFKQYVTDLVQQISAEVKVAVQ